MDDPSRDDQEPRAHARAGVNGFGLADRVEFAAPTVIIPAEYAQFARRRNIELAGATHYSYLLRPSAWALVWEILQDASRWSWSK